MPHAPSAIVDTVADFTSTAGDSVAAPAGDSQASGADVITLSAPVQGVPHHSSDLAGCAALDGRASSSTRTGDFRPAACLSQLSEASASQLKRFGASLHDDAAEDVDFATVIGEKGSAQATANWWSTLTTTRRQQLIDTMPGVVGNLEGVPYTVRDVANRLTLTTTINDLELEQTRAQFGLVSFGDEARRLTMLQQVSIALQRGREGDDATRQLVSLDTVFPGRAAVSVGDLDTADNVSLMVPGMLYTVSNQITYWTDRAADLHSEQELYSNALASQTNRPTTSATVAWMGYRTPDLTNVLSLTLARAGAVHLEDTVRGLDAERQADLPRVNVIAHSYGSTTATIALSSGKIHVDSLTVLGSPGSVVPRADDLAVTRGSVYAAAAALDPVAGSGVFGVDPGGTSFGATLLNVAGGTDPFTEQHLAATFTHNTYFMPGSESIRNLALIGIGQGSLAGGRAPAPSAPAGSSEPSLAYVRPQDVYRESLAV
ncbi:alpha/beta hydrolase [Frondihabitans australicus]|uniref:Alpha/beta hydrolase family protein n=1 Tax=Frondihabitans australicus TaxID=386892 RepID=A0A495IFI0_9MICO|nr:alpha/beta hydrolase [Frondihabitans australicus]RKR74694.1 alpha/beta hydrolase family protein [Frondihabitans australicus]